jgi:hypothetical protein
LGLRWRSASPSDVLSVVHSLHPSGDLDLTGLGGPRHAITVLGRVERPHRNREAEGRTQPDCTGWGEGGRDGWGEFFGAWREGLAHWPPLAALQRYRTMHVGKGRLRPSKLFTALIVAIRVRGVDIWTAAGRDPGGLESPCASATDARTDVCGWLHDGGEGGTL